MLSSPGPGHQQWGTLRTSEGPVVSLRPRHSPLRQTRDPEPLEAPGQPGPTWVLLSVWEFNLNVIVPGDLLYLGTFRAHD